MAEATVLAGTTNKHRPDQLYRNDSGSPEGNGLAKGPRASGLVKGARAPGLAKGAGASGLVKGARASGLVTGARARRATDARP